MTARALSGLLATRRRTARSVARVPLLAPGIALVVVTERSPRTPARLVDQLQAADPLGALPEVQVRDEEPGRAAVLGVQVGSP